MKYLLGFSILSLTTISPAPVSYTHLRGVNSSGALAKLQAFDLIKEDGKKEVLGRPNLYVTTDYFLDYMGINHLEELPVIDELEIQAQESQLFGERIEEDENQ